MSRKDRREDKPSWFESFLEFTEHSDPTLFNIMMVIVIVGQSALLAFVMWWISVNWVGVSPVDNWGALAFWLSALTALVVATPAVVFGYLLVARVQIIRDALRKSLEETRIANRAKTEFLANMSHEIRTPLNGVLGMVQILDRSDLNPHQREALSMIGESGTLLIGVIDDVLDLSKIESGQISIDPRPERLVPLLASTVELFRARALQNETELTFRADHGVPERVIYDSVRARQCLANLVSNAIKFTKKGAVSVTVSAVAEEQGWRIIVAVRDTGIGIAPETLSRLFQPFEQADASTSREYGGTGLGLALSRRFARLMGGDISVESRPGEGSCFELRFRAGDIGLIEGGADETVRDTQDLAWINGLRLLIVDDSHINRKVVKGLLAPLGPTCLEAENGAQALEMLETEPVDLVLLDMHMPVMDGLTTLAELRKKPLHIAEIPVVVVTADVLHGRREEFLASGFQGFLSKPLRRAALEAELIRLKAEVLARNAEDPTQLSS